MSYSETYESEKDRLPEMKMYHENNVHTSRQEEQMEKDICLLYTSPSPRD